MLRLQGFPPLLQTLFFTQTLSPTSLQALQIPSASSTKTTRRSLKDSHRPNLRKLTSRIVQLTRRRQLRQIFEEVEREKRRYGNLNTIVMNAVMEACVQCGDIDSAIQVFQKMSKPEGCGVDSITFGTLLKGLGKARRIDEAFLILESVEQGTALGNSKLSPPPIYGLLNALLEAGDLRRANALLARHRSILHEGGPTILTYNLLIKGYTNTDFPLDALNIRDEIFRQGLKPDRLTYNSLIFACVKAGRMESAMQLFAEMKEEALRVNSLELLPDAITYTTLIKGFGNTKNLLSVLNIVVEMKASSDLFIDRVAYTAMIDAFLMSGSTIGALCILAEMFKRAGENLDLRPKPHVFLSLMRSFAVKGDLSMVKRLHSRMLPDSVGSISRAFQVEANELHMEAAMNNGQVDTAKRILSTILARREGISWGSRAGMVVIRLEVISGFVSSMCSPYLLSKVFLDDPVEKYMTPFEEAKPLHDGLYLKKVVMRFFMDAVVPIIDDWGSCIGILHRKNCNELDAPLSRMMKGPPPCATTSTSIGRVIELLLQKQHRMIIIVKPNHIFETSYSSSSKFVGVFTYDQLFELAIPVPSPGRTFT